MFFRSNSHGSAQFSDIPLVRRSICPKFKVPFVKENECTYINGQVKCWDESRNHIFRAFKGYKGPRCNQAEVIYAGWIHRNHRDLRVVTEKSTLVDVTNILNMLLREMTWVF